MDIEFRKNNTYFDRTGTQILVGDLLKVYHFTVGKKIYYMYHVAEMEESGDFPVMSVADYRGEKPHCRMYVLCNNSQRVYKDAKILNKFDIISERKKIKIL